MKKLANKSDKNAPKLKKNTALSTVADYFKEFGTAVSKGSLGVKISLLLMGTGYLFNGQFIKGLLVFLVEAAFIVMLIKAGVPFLSKFSTLGTVKREQVFDPLTMQNTVNDYDNSFMILLGSVVVIFTIFLFILFYIANIKNIYKLEKNISLGRKVNSFKDDIRDMFASKFHITLLTLPILGIILMNIIPILILIAVAFTNYDQNHMPPNELFTWVGFSNFVKLFSGTVTSSFGYAFRKILGWTIVWAVFATFTTFIGGVLLARLINSKLVVAPKFWRTLFIIAIAIPQFVTLLLVRNFFADAGIVNAICSNIGITSLLQNMGLVHGQYIPFLTDPKWAKFMIIMINIWCGVPYQMLISTGVLMNIPSDQIEAAKIDGANSFQIFMNVTMPYILFIQGPALITDFVRNINNFNVIYLLTQDVYVTKDQLLANSHGKEVDLLVTWLFRLTNEYYDYKMASVIGIIVFIICALFTIITFRRMMSGGREEVYQ